MRSSRRWSLAPADARRLRSEGFISFTVEPIRGPRETAGLTNVALYKTAEGAKHSMAHDLRPDVIRAGGPSRTSASSPSAGVPGARGWTASEPHVGNVLWVQGRCDSRSETRALAPSRAACRQACGRSTSAPTAGARSDSPPARRISTPSSPRSFGAPSRPSPSRTDGGESHDTDGPFEGLNPTRSKSCQHGSQRAGHARSGRSFCP